MRFTLKTFVPQPVEVVKAKFDQRLFKALAPPFPRMQLLRFDGSALGDEVHIKLNFLVYSTVWKSLITEETDTDEGFFFVDEGIQLPPFITYWRHKHILNAYRGGTVIVDDVEFRVKPLLLSPFLFASTWLQFVYRKPIYKGYQWKRE